MELEAQMERARGAHAGKEGETKGRRGVEEKGKAREREGGRKSERLREEGKENTGMNSKE